MLLVLQEKQADLSVMTTIVDEQGTDVSLAGCLATERTSLCQVRFAA